MKHFLPSSVMLIPFVVKPYPNQMTKFATTNNNTSKQLN